MKTTLNRWAATALLMSALFFSGCGGSDDFVRTGFAPTGPAPAPAPPPAPSAVDDNYDSIGNAKLRVTAADGVLANDSLNGAAISTFDSVSAEGGSVDVQADGSFEYTPPNNTTGVTDTFAYTLENSQGASTATVSVDLNNLGRYVDNSSAPGGDGTLSNPYDTIQAAINASSSGDTVFVLYSLAPYNEDITLIDGINVQGEGAGFTIDNGLARTVEVRPSVVQPEGDAPVLQGTATMASDSSLSGLKILAGSMQGVIGTSISDVTIRKNEVVGASFGVEFTDVTGEVLIENNEFVDITSEAIRLQNSGSGETELRCNANMFNQGLLTASRAILAESTSGALNLTADGNIVPGSMATGYGVFLEQNTSGAGSQNSSLTCINNTVFSLGVAVTTSQSTSGNFDLRGNTFTGACILNLIGGAPGANPFVCRLGGPNSEDANSFDDLGSFSGNVIVSAPPQDSQVVCQNNRLNVQGIFVQLVAGRGSYVISDNDLTNTTNNATLQVLMDDSSGMSTLACRDNVLPSLGVIDTNVVNALDACAAISGNMADEIRLIQSGSGEYSVEGLDAPEGGPLSTLNNGATITESGTLTSVDIGSCGI